jgi:glyoxylase-like metal-dependent hydrolase (beta-lactamase superfamily II)
MKTILFALAFPIALGSQSTNPAKNFKVEKLAEGVYAVIRQDAVGFMVDANNVFIVNDNDVVVVDANGAPGITREVIAALRKITRNPVRYVINTHWHDDHIRGNKVYRDAFPGVEFIGQATMREYLPGQGATNRKNFLTGRAPVSADAQTIAGSRKVADGRPAER